MDFDDFEWSQGAPTPATMSETMRDMFLFRKKKYVFYEKMWEHCGRDQHRFWENRIFENFG